MARPRTPATGRPDDPVEVPGPDDAAALAERVAALSRAGLPPTRVWEVAAEQDPRWADLGRAVRRTVRLGGGTAEALRPLQPSLALACRVSETTGASLADVLDGLASTLRADADAAREQDAALAGPRATATLLSWLPLGGLVLAALAGVDPLGVLLRTGPGRGCLVVGGVLWWVGRRWTGALVRRAASAAGP